MGKGEFSPPEIELIASFRLRRLHQNLEWITEEQLARIVAEEQNLPSVVLDPLQLDYRLLQIISEAHSQSAIWLSHLNKTATA